MKRDIFEFWSRIPDEACVHPADQAVLNRVPHRFQTDCPPISFFGPLRTAPVVLLFLSPGHYPDFDGQHGCSKVGQAYYRSQRDGRGKLPSPDDHGPAHDWWTGIVNQFGVEPRSVVDQIAIFNIGAYHSSSFHDWHMLTALPSSRVALDWAQFVLFPEAEAGKRTVVCLRSARLWGLEKDECHGKALFAPLCTPGGKMHHGPMREQVIKAVRRALRAT